MLEVWDDCIGFLGIHLDVHVTQISFKTSDNIFVFCELAVAHEGSSLYEPL